MNVISNLTKAGKAFEADASTDASFSMVTNGNTATTLKMTANLSITSMSQITQCKHHIDCHIEQEIIVLNLKNGNYYNFDSLASEIWNAIQEPISVEALVHKLCYQYAVSESTCTSDIINFLNALLEIELIDLR